MKAFVETDLAFGDSGKGSITHWLCKTYGASTVVRTGGCQALHNVMTKSGLHFCHAHFGSGTLVGADTYLSKHMMIDPYGIINEGNALREKVGYVFDRLTISEDCLVITPWQKIANHLRELSRGDGRHGSVGIGIGETAGDAKIIKDQAIFAIDLGKPWLRDKLAAIQQLKQKQMIEVIDSFNNLTPQIKEEIRLLNSEALVNSTLDTFNGFVAKVPIVPDDYLDSLLKRSIQIVFEPSQGVLIDQDYGFYPYTTYVNSTSSDALALLKDHGYRGEIRRLGLIRGYQHRHGPGPFVTEDAKLDDRLIDPCNTFHPWQRGWRVGQLDTIMLQYAIDVCGGHRAFDGLAVNCLDLIDNNQIPYEICSQYIYDGNDNDLDNFFYLQDQKIIGIKVYRGTDLISHQERLGQLLNECKPILTDHYDFKNYLRAIEEITKIDIVLKSFGPTEADKKITSKWY